MARNPTTTFMNDFKRHRISRVKGTLEEKIENKNEGVEKYEIKIDTY